MPKVMSYTPAWLSKPNPGHEIFTSKVVATQPASSNGSSTSSKRTAKPGPRRTIARRGTEVFIAVGKEIRWADLVYLKEAWEDKQSRNSFGKEKGRDGDNQYEGDHAQGYRVSSPVTITLLELIIVDHQNPGCGRHSTANHLSTRELYCNIDDAYGPCRHPTRTLTAHGS
jgi:nucleoporin NUP82